jgi:uncharacterized protein YfdQ (DUF2303 family)
MQSQDHHSSIGIDLVVVERLTGAAQAPKQPGRTKQYILVPTGYSKEEIPALHELPLPTNIVQRLSLATLESFNRYVKKFGRHNTQLFGQITNSGCQFYAAIDYHEAGKDGSPDHLQHIAEYAPKFSDEFAAWLAINGKGLTQDALLDHLRKWGYTITSHTDADMIEMVSGLEFSTSGSFSSRVERTTGGRKLTFNEEVQGSAQSSQRTVTVPDSMKMRSSIFVDGSEFDYDAEMLYRVGGGKLSITVELKRVHRVVREAIDSIIKDIESETQYQPLIGFPTLPS